MPSRYVKPVQGELRRLDQGIDYQGTPGDSVVAMGLARVDAVKDDPGGFGKAIYYTLLTGPMKGQQIYVGHASPTVHARQIVQAGDPVATLLQHSLGNATHLSGWTEIGFAKGGAPQANSAKRFQSFVKQAGEFQAVAPAPVQSDGAVQTGAAPSLPQAGQDTQTGAQPIPAETLPYEPAPGSGINSASSFAADTWNRIASQPGSSPDAQLLATNAQTIGV